MPRFDDDWIDFILRPERRGSPPASAILDLIGIDAGMIVADVGCGPGFLTLPAATRLGPSGKIYAIDVEPTMLDFVARAAREQRLANVETRRASGPRIPLDDAIADLTLCALVLHDFEDPSPMACELARITRPGGRLAIIEWTPAVEDPRRNRVPPERTASVLRAAGRAPDQPIVLSDRQYLIIA